MRIYDHKDLKTNYSKLAKTWRRSKAERHQDISNFTQATFNDPDRDLTMLVKNINSLIIPPKMRQTLWLLITNSLYCGEVAHYYQKEKKSIKDGDPRLVPLHNLYAKHQYQHGYAPQNYRPPATTQVNTYKYIFWDGHMRMNWIK